jgi:hypothetical protein
MLPPLEQSRSRRSDTLRSGIIPQSKGVRGQPTGKVEISKAASLAASFIARKNAEMTRRLRGDAPLGSDSMSFNSSRRQKRTGLGKNLQRVGPVAAGVETVRHHSFLINLGPEARDRRQLGEFDGDSFRTVTCSLLFVGYRRHRLPETWTFMRMFCANG